MEGTTGTRLRQAATVLAAWAVILAVVLTVGWLITHALASDVEPWDDDVARWFAAQRTGDLTTAADAATFLGDTPVGLALAVVAAGALSLWQRSGRPAAFFAVLVVGVGGIYGLATLLVSRQRPPVRILDPGLVPDHSYPSGHVATAITVYGGTALLVWWLAPRARRWVWVLALVPVLVALSRLYEGAHHVTDVLASVCFATAWLAVVFTVLYRRSG
jgi:membrane-associated phospholipid phosphatase